jgi:hypothetical protein
MSTDPAARSDDEIAEEIVKPLEDLLAKEDEELKKAEEIIRAAESKAKRVLDPEL